MLIWGTKGKVKEKDRGIFYCPNCQARRGYVLYELGKYFTLYFISIFRTKKIAEYVECTVCKMQFKSSVLINSALINLGLIYNFEDEVDPEDDVETIILKFQTSVLINSALNNLGLIYNPEDDVKDPEDDVEEIISNICSFFEKGMPAHIIVQHLLESGWEKDDLEAIISKFCSFLDEGMPAHIIVQHLLESGWEKDDVETLVYLALGGIALQCPDCGAVFSSEADHCSQCGSIEWNWL